MKELLIDIKNKIESIEDASLMNTIKLQVLVNEAAQLIGNYKEDIGKILKENRDNLNLYIDGAPNKNEIFNESKENALKILNAFIKDFQ